jgi:hypothetical protein
MTFRVWAHAHTRLSRDADLTHEALRDAAARQGVRAVLLTEHQEALRAGEAETAAERCRRLSDDRVLLVPGLEIASDERYHVLGFGLTRRLEAAPAGALAERIRKEGGYPVLAHPGRYRRGWERCLAAVGAVEVWNRHYDGRLAPPAAVVDVWRSHPGVRAVFGLDAHGPEALDGRLPELRVDAVELTEGALLAALAAGRFATGLGGRRFEPGGAGAGRWRSLAGGAYRRCRAAVRRLSYVLPLSEGTRRRWGRRL